MLKKFIDSLFHNLQANSFKSFFHFVLFWMFSLFFGSLFLLVAVPVVKMVNPLYPLNYDIKATVIIFIASVVLVPVFNWIINRKATKKERN